MNMTEAPSDNAEVERLLREEDNLGSDSSLFLRVFRQLTSDGKPIGEIIGLTVPVGNGQQMPLGMLTITKSSRLVFWPVLPRRGAAITNKPWVKVPDHVTIEFPSEKVHVTYYGEAGKPTRTAEGWRSAPFEGPEFRLLFAFFVRMKVITDQDILVGRKFVVPTNDKDRRTAEFAQSAGKMVFQHFPIPGSPSDKHFVYFGIFAVPGLMTAQTLPTSLMPKTFIEEMVDDWPTDTEFPLIVGQGLAVENQTLCLAAGFLPGKLKDDMCFGFPMRGPPPRRSP